MKEEKSYLGLISIIVTILIITTWFLTYQLLKDNPKRGEIGDMFGSINALFSGLALSGIILSILLQRNELQLQRQELINTRLEFKQQNQTLILQRFENTFFNMLNLHHQIVNNMDLDETSTYYQGMNAVKENIKITGRDVFEKKYYELAKELNKDIENFNKIYDSFYAKSNSDLGHYFRNLYRIIKLVNETKFSIDEKEDFETKYKYTSMVRAQLSDFELLILFYNCLHENGNEKFKPLIEKFSLFKNIPKKHVYDKHYDTYDKSAFKIK